MNKTTVLLVAVLAEVTVMEAGIIVLPSIVHGSAVVTQPGEISSGNGINTARTVQNNGEKEGGIEMKCEDLAGYFDSSANQPDRRGYHRGQFRNL